jgi:hypothetical protein
MFKEGRKKLQCVEQDFWGSYHNDGWVIPEGDLPCAPGAQQEPEEDNAGFLQQTDTEDEVPPQMYVVMPEGNLAVPPCPPAAQPDPEEDDAGLFQQTVTAGGVPRQNYNDECQMYVSLGEEEQPLLVESQNYDDMTPPVDEDETAHPEDLMADFQMNFPQLFLTEEPEMIGCSRRSCLVGRLVGETGRASKISGASIRTTP